MSFGQNLLQLVFDKFAKRATCEFFFKFGFIFAACWIRTEKVNADRKIGQFFAGFFHILKTKKSVLQLKRRQLCSQGKKNAHVILFTHERA